MNKSYSTIVYHKTGVCIYLSLISVKVLDEQEFHEKTLIGLYLLVDTYGKLDTNIKVNAVMKVYRFFS